MENFENAGDWVREKRNRATLGLRQFAILIGDSPSNVCNIENGNRPIWQNEKRLRRVASVLGIKEHSEEWETLFSLAQRPDRAPADVTKVLQMELVPTLLRTIDQYQLNDDDIQKLLKYVERTFGKGRSQRNGKHR